MMLTDDILGLYQLVAEEEHYFLSEHQKRISFYAGLISALLGGTVAGYLSCKQWHHFLFLTSGPIAIAFISNIAKDGIRRMYQRFLEAVTVRAKIEERYGMAELPRPAGKNKQKIPAQTNSLTAQTLRPRY